MRLLLIVLLLSASAASAISADAYALRGTLVTPDEVIENGVLLVQDGKIAFAGAGADAIIPGGVREIETGGFIFPGLIDLHNHITWNAHPRWSPGTLVKNRYEWQALDSYSVWLSGPHEKVRPAECDLERFGEVKALAWGATTVAGSLLKDCSRGLARNADRGDDFVPPVQYRIFPFELRPEDEESVRTALADGKPVIVHLAEGVDASSARELRMARAHGFLRRGLVIIHGVALRENDFDELGRAGVGLVWSPRSNIELYGRTADVAAAKKHVVMAIAPDWSPSGSSGMIPELRYADLWSDQQIPPIFTAKELVQMATSNPARLAQIDDRVGHLAKGFYADYLVIRRGARTDPYESLIYAAPEDILLVAVNGRPLFGDVKLLPAVNPSAKPEIITLCNAPKALDLSGENISFAETVERLEAAFGLFQVLMSDLCP
jgi:5-methylthioadenosine/S-adenosylhomocysteine deaminase